MVSAIGAQGTQRMMDQLRTGGARSVAKAAAPAQSDETAKAATSTPAAALAALGAPIDTDKVAAIKAGIADGSYTVNPRAIADKMIALDLPSAA